MTDLSAKTILVTNADTETGAATVAACSAAGARVIAQYASRAPDGEARVCEAGAARRDTIAADLEIPEHPSALWNAALDRANRIDALVNIAGVYYPSSLNGGDLEWVESWRRAMQLNLTAPADLSRAAAPHFRTNRGGALVNVSPLSPDETGGPLDAAFMAARAGLIAMSRTLTRGPGSQNYAVYALAPGEGDAARAPEDRSGLQDWIRGLAYPSIDGAEATGSLIAMMCAEAAPASPYAWSDATLLRPVA